MIQIFRILFVLLFFAGPLSAQGTNVPFGGLKHDSSLPVELSADSLALNQANGTAIAKGNVLAGQGTLRIQADTLTVDYVSVDGQLTGEIAKMTATGKVTLTNGGEAAEAQNAIYTVASGKVVMTGDVILTQGQNALAGERLNIDLNSGTANIEGRVRAIFQPASQQ